jgi:hypothetical protein
MAFPLRDERCQFAPVPGGRIRRDFSLGPRPAAWQGGTEGEFAFVDRVLYDEFMSEERDLLLE